MSVWSSELSKMDELMHDCGKGRVFLTVLYLLFIYCKSFWERSEEQLSSKRIVHTKSECSKRVLKGVSIVQFPKM